MKKLISLVLVFVFTISCANQRIFSSAKSQKSVPNYEKSQAFFVYGIGQTKEVNAQEICNKNGGVEKTETIQEPVEVLLQVITLGIYTPRTVKIYCKS
jgi:ERCC4-type nuclease